MSTLGFRECKQTLWSLFQSYSFAEEVPAPSRESAAMTAAPAVASEQSDGWPYEVVVTKVVREPEFRSIMSAFVLRSNFERFFSLAENSEADDALMVERALSRLSSEPVLAKLWMQMALARARRRKTACAISSPSQRGGVDESGGVGWIGIDPAEDDSLELLFLPSKKTSNGGEKAKAAALEVSPAVTVDWTVLSSTLYVYMHDSLRLHTVDAETVLKARAALWGSGAEASSGNDARGHRIGLNNNDSNRDGGDCAHARSNTTRMSIATDADSYRPGKAPYFAETERPLALPDQLRQKLDRAPLEALHRMLSSRHTDRGCGGQRSPPSIVIDREGSGSEEPRGRGTIEIPVEDEEDDDEHAEDSCLGNHSPPQRPQQPQEEREESPCVSTVRAEGQERAARRHAVTPPGNQAAAPTPRRRGERQQEEAPAKPVRRTKTQLQEEPLYRLATPQRARGEGGAGSPKKLMTPLKQRRATPRRRVTPQKKTTQQTPAATGEVEMARGRVGAAASRLPSPSKLCCNEVCSGRRGATGAHELGKPAPPPRRKNTQKVAAAITASVVRYRNGAGDDVGDSSSPLGAAQQLPAPLHSSHSPLFTRAAASSQSDGEHNGTSSSSGSSHGAAALLAEKQWEEVDTRGDHFRGSQSPPPREPCPAGRKKHLAYIVGSGGGEVGKHLHTLSGIRGGGGGLQQREPSEANKINNGGSGGGVKTGKPRKEAAGQQAPHVAPLVIRTRGRVGGGATSGSGALLGSGHVEGQHAHQQRRKTGGHSPAPLPEPQPPQLSAVASLASSPLSTSISGEEVEGRHTTALPVEASSIHDGEGGSSGAPLPNEQGDIDVDALTSKAAGQRLPPTALSRARQRWAPAPPDSVPTQRVATAPSVSLTPRDGSHSSGNTGDTRLRGAAALPLPPPTTRESPVLSAAQPPQQQRTNPALSVPPATAALAPCEHQQCGQVENTSVAQEASVMVEPHRMSQREEMQARRQEAREEVCSRPAYVEPPGLRSTVLLRGVPFSHVDAARSFNDCCLEEAQRTPPKQVFHRMDDGADQKEATRGSGQRGRRARSSIRVTAGAELTGDAGKDNDDKNKRVEDSDSDDGEAHLFAIPVAAESFYYNLHNHTTTTTPPTPPLPQQQQQQRRRRSCSQSPSTEVDGAGGASMLVTPPSHHLSPQKAITPLRAYRSLLPPFNSHHMLRQTVGGGGQSPTPRGSGSGGASPPPPARLSARARRLSRSLSRGGAHCRDDGREAPAGGSGCGPVTPPRVPLTRCRSSGSVGGDLQVSVLVSPRRTCGVVNGLMTAMASSSTPTSPQLSATPRISRPPHPLSPGKD